MSIIGLSVLKHHIQLYISNTTHKWFRGWSVLEREILTELSLFSSMRKRSSQNQPGWPLTSLPERGNPVFDHRFPQKLHGFLWKMRETHISPGWRYHNSRFKSKQQWCWYRLPDLWFASSLPWLSQLPVLLDFDGCAIRGKNSCFLLYSSPRHRIWKFKTTFLQFRVSYFVLYVNRFCKWRASTRGSNANKGRLDKCLSS